MSLDNKVVDLADLKVSHDYLLEQDGLLSDRIDELGSGIDDVESIIGDLSNLSTTLKNNIVSAINEVLQTGGRVQSVNGKTGDVVLKTSDLTNDSGYLTSYTETDPTVPSWAKQTSKPTYTAQEVGASSVEDMNSEVNTRRAADAQLQSQITALGNGAPIPVETVAEMIDNTKAYLYTGAEVGWLTGYWYTYDSAQAKFVPRGEYGVGTVIDNTLTVSGDAADAKATGDAISEVNGRLDEQQAAISDISGNRLIPQTMNVEIAGSWNGDFTDNVITRGNTLLSVFAECTPGVRYTISKTATKRFSVFFTEEYPAIGVEIMEYRIIDQKTAASITAVAPEGAKYICAYVYNENTDSSYGTMEEIRASVNIVAQSAIDMVSRDGLNVGINRIDDIEKTLHGGDVSLTWEHGGIGLDGASQSDAKRIRTRSLITKSDTPTDIILSGSTYQFSVRYYDSNGGFLSADTVWRSASLYDVFSQVENCEAIKIVSRLSTNTTMTDSDMENVQSALSVNVESMMESVIPLIVRQAIYNLFAHAAYSTTVNVSSDIATLQSWAEVE